MPLLNKKEVPSAPRFAPAPGAKEVFVIRCTGECVEKYEDYLAKFHQYNLPQWQEKYFNKAGLTYEEALAIERNVEEQIRSQFPKELEGQVLTQIQHSTLRKDELVNKIYDSLRPASPGADKENGQQDSPAAPSSSQPAPAITKKLLTLFLIYVAEKHKPGIWVCKEQWVQQYMLPTELPEGLKLAQAEPASPAPGAAKASSVVAGDATPMKTPLRSKPNAADGQAAPVRTLEEEEAKLKPGSIKAIALQVMKARGASQPVTVDDIVRITTTDGTCIDWPDKRKRSLANVLQADAAFVRVARAQYTLRALAGDLPIMSPLGQGQAGSGGPHPAGAKDAMAAAFAGASGGGADGQKPLKGPKEAAESEEQLSGLARAEKLLVQAQKAVAARQADADAVNAVLEACEKRLAEAKQAKAAKRESDAAEAAAYGEAKPDLDSMFALPEHLRQYTGPEDDRKAKSAWRHERSNEEKRLKKERDAYLQQQRLEAAKRANSDVAALQAALDRAKKSAEEAAAKLERAKKAEGDAKRAMEREKQREMLKDIKEKSKADKEKQKQAEKEERERRRQEALAAKRYPIDDLALLTEELTAAAAAAAGPSRTASAAADTAARPSTSAAAAAAAESSAAEATGKGLATLLPPEQLDVPCLSEAKHLPPEQSEELGQLLYVADTLGQFSRQLGVNGCSHAELQGMLEAAAAAAAAEAADEKQREALKWLAHTYQQLLKVLVGDVVETDNVARIFNRWSAVLECGVAAWPEMARRWVLVQEQDGLASPQAVAVAHFLRDHEASLLSPQQHLVLLSQLLDDCLDTSLVRDMLNHRIEEAAERAAAVRAELHEGRKKLRELVDAEKESRKRKRAAALALATAAAERQLKEKGLLPAPAADGKAAADGPSPAANGEAAPAAAGGGAAGPSGAGAEDQVAKKIKATTKEILERVAGPGISGVTLAELEAELAADLEEEPTWALPPELREYSGPAGDKKAMSEFRRKQQEARKQLEKQQARWQADKAKRDKAKAEAKKKEVEAEKRLQLERQRAEEALAEQQERLEQQLEKFLVRRQPLGNDRYNRQYWWGLAGNKEGLLLQQEVGCAETTLVLLQEAATAAAAATDKGEQQQEGVDATANVEQQRAGTDQQEKETSQQQQQQGSSRRASVSEAGVGKELLAPLNHKGLLLPPGPEGWALIDDVGLLESLAAGLEQRGIREKELKATLEKMLPTISAAVAKVVAAKAAAAAAAEGGSGMKDKSKHKKHRDSTVVPRELPSRHARSAAAEQIKKTGTAAAAKAKEEPAPAPEDEEEDETGPLRGWPLAAFKAAASNIQALSVPAAAAKVAVPGPSSSWAEYRTHLDALVHGEIPEAWAVEAAAAATAAALGCAAADDAAAAGVPCAKDAAWTRAVLAAAQAAAAAADAPQEQQEQAAPAAALAQLRLQLLSFEEQLVAVSGECPYLYRDAAAAWPDDEDGEQAEEGEEETAEPSSEGEAEHPQEEPQPQPDKQQKRGRGRGSKQQQLQAAQEDAQQQEVEQAMEVDGDEQPPQQQKRGRGRPTKAAAAAAAAAAATDADKGVSSRGTKRSAAAAAAASGSGHAEADGAAEHADAEGGAPSAKRRKQAGAGTAAGLPPRPAGCSTARGRAASAAAAEGEAEGTGAQHYHSPGSREGSVAPACSGAAAAAAAGGAAGSNSKASSKKRGRQPATPSAAGSSRAASQEPEQQQQQQQQQQGEDEDQQEAEQEQQQRGKKQPRRGRAGKGSRKAAAAAAAAESDDGKEQGDDAAGNEGIEDGVGPGSKAIGFAVGAEEGAEEGDGMQVDEHEEGRRRHSLPHKHSSHEQQGDDDADEEVAEEEDTVIPIRLSGRTLWRTAEERGSWRATVAAAGTASCLAYCAAALVFHAEQPLEKLAASAAKKSSKGGSRR